MPAQAVAERAEAEAFALPVILEQVAVVTGRAKKVETNAIAPPMRSAFESGLEKARESLAHGTHQCARKEMEPNLTPGTKRSLML